MNLDALCIGEPLDVGPGIYLNMPREQYDRIPAFSQSVLKKWLELGSIPAEFQTWLLYDRTKPSKSESMLLGSMLDCLILEHDTWDSRYIRIPDTAPKKPSSAQREAAKPSAKTVEAIAWWDAFERQAAGKQIVSHDQLDAVMRMKASLEKKPSSRAILENSQKASVVAEINGYLCKSEFDLWIESSTHLSDLKAMEDVGLGFADSFKKFGYNSQATFYLRMAEAAGYPKDVFDFLCVKNDRPWTVKINSFSPQDDPKHGAIEEASWIMLERAMNQLAEHLETKTWQDAIDYELIPISNAWSRWARDIKEAA